MSSLSEGLAAVREICEITRRSPRSGDGAQAAVELLEAAGYEYSAVLLVDERVDRLVPIALGPQGQGPEFVEDDLAFVGSSLPALDRGITGWVAQSGFSLRLDDASNDPRYFGMRRHIRSELCVPMRDRAGRVFGVVNTETQRSGAYGEDDQRLLEIAADQIGLAIERRRLDEAVVDFLPLCSYCKSYREPGGSWQPIEGYLLATFRQLVTHGICPPCKKEHIVDTLRGSPDDRED